MPVMAPITHQTANEWIFYSGFSLKIQFTPFEMPQGFPG